MKHQHTQECNELLGSISEYVDGSLREELCRELERHLSECDDCRVVVDTMTKTIELYQAESPREDLPADVRQRLYKSLHLDDLLPCPMRPAPQRALSSLELLLMGIGQPETPRVEPLRSGSACPQCGLGRLDYNGLLQLECPRCGYASGEGGGCT